MTVTKFQLRELSPQSRISIHNVPINAPGVCFACNSSGGDGRQFVDFGRTMKWVGTIYFCSECIREIAEAVGFYPAEAMKLLMDANKEFSEANANLKLNVKELSESQRTLARSLAYCNCGLDGPDPVVLEVDSDPERSKQNDPESDESVSFEGLGNIHSPRGSE